jgi:hypothetical protein
MTSDDATAFQKAFDAAINEIKGVPELGLPMIDAIGRATPEVLVMKPATGTENACTREVHSSQAADAACYAEVLSDDVLCKKIQSLITAKKIDVSHPAVKKFEKFYVKNENRTKIFERSVPLAHKPKDDRPRGADQILDERIRLADSESNIVAAIGSVRSLQQGLIAYHIMDELTPGPGTSAIVVWDPAGTDVSNLVDEKNRAPWMVRPTWIALAHELIHAWRFVTGRRVFSPVILGEDYYEEAMTVGLPPYDRCKFTENRFRQSKGLPLRAFYGASTQAQSVRAQKKHGSVDDRLKTH